MTDPVDVFAELDAAARSHDENEVALRGGFRDQWKRVETRLQNKHGVRFSSTDFVLEAVRTPVDDFDLIGHFYLNDEGRVGFAWLNTLDAALNSEHEPDGPYYSVIMNVMEIPYAWLRVMVDQGHFKRFVGELARHLSNDAQVAADRTRQMGLSSSGPLTSVSNEVVEAARECGFERVASKWRRAQAEAQSNPDGAVALACTLVEEAGQHILVKLGKVPSQDRSIGGVVRAVSDVLGLDESKQADPTLTRLCGALTTLTTAIGHLRTKHSEAHGHPPTVAPIGRTQAVLAVNAAGLVVTFLMQRLMEHERATALSGAGS